MSDPVPPVAEARAVRSLTATDEELIAVESLVKYYPIMSGVLRRKVGDVKAVDDVTFAVAKGEVLGLVGESGCGKSTLGRTLLRLLPATAGTIRYRGEDVSDRSGPELRMLRRKLQIIFQDPYGSLNPRMPVNDIIGEGLLAQADKENGWAKRSVREERIGQYLEAVGLRRDYARRFPHEFSGGQRQRIGIARALVLEPDFIVCDEPVSALDVSIQSQILNLLLDLRARVRPDLPLHRPQPLGRAVRQRPGRRHVPGPARGAGARGRAVRGRRATPTRWRSSRPCPSRTPRQRRTAHHPQGRPALTGRAAGGLPLPHALLAARAAGRPGAVRDGAPGAACHLARPRGRLPLPGAHHPEDRGRRPRTRWVRAPLPHLPPDPALVRLVAERAS